MSRKVDDTPENMEICKRFCGPCPTFKPNGPNEVEPHALFCARGASSKPREQIEVRYAIASTVMYSGNTGWKADGSAFTG